MGVAGWWAEAFTTFGDPAATGLSFGDMAVGLGGPIITFGDPAATGLSFGDMTIATGSVDVDFGAPVSTGVSFGDMTVDTSFTVTFGDPATTGISFGDMTVSRTVAKPTIVGVDIAATTSVAIPAHQAGDMFLLCAYDTASAIVAIPSAGGTVPTWSGIGSNGGLRTAWALATSNDHTSGTWTNVDNLVVLVLRNQNSSPIGGNAVDKGSFSTAPPAPAVTMTSTDGTSELVHFHCSIAPGITWDAAPTGYTRQATGTQMAVNTKNTTTSDGSIAQGTVTNTTWRTATVEILPAPA